MKVKRAIGAALLTLVSTVSGLAVSSPAFAARSGFAELWRGENHYMGWVDNGNRSIRLRADEGYGFHADFYEYNTAGNMYKLYVDAGKDWTWYLPQPVSKWRICGPNGGGGDACSGWISLDR